VRGCGGHAAQAACVRRAARLRALPAWLKH